MALNNHITQALSGTTLLSRLLLIVGVSLVSVGLYSGGLSGVFVLDDTPNLNIINQLPPNPRWQDFWLLANTGMAGVLGRPLSLLSFLLQYQAWPDPFQFKLVNLALHLCNGALLAWLCVLLRQQTRWQVNNGLIALVVFVWLTHPLQASTVFYVVQRMTELTTLFTLAGINLYLIGRRHLQHQRGSRGIVYLCLGLFGCGALALLSKENGVLLLAYVVVLEFTLLAAGNDSRLLTLCRRYLVYLPTVLGVLALLVYLPTVLQGYELKPFTMAERVFSQFSVLLTYLISGALLLPDYFGVFHDDFPIVTGVLQPWYTLPSILIVLGVLVLAVYKHKQWPLFAFGVLWYLSGHVLESTVLPLEIYFEHRNYLALFGPILALVYKLGEIRQLQAIGRRQVLSGAVTLLVLWMCALTWQQARLWGDAHAFATAAIARHPQSARAQSNLVETLTQNGQAEAALNFHLTTIDPQQHRIAPYIRWLEFRCLLPAATLPDNATLRNQAQHADHDFAAISLLNNLTFGIIQNRCPNGPTAQLDLVLENLLMNPAFTVSRADLLQMRGFLAAARRDFAAAADFAAASFVVRQDVRVALYRATWLVRGGERADALREFQSLSSMFQAEIAASSDLTARYQFLQYELNLIR